MEAAFAVLESEAKAKEEVENNLENAFSTSDRQMSETLENTDI